VKCPDCGVKVEKVPLLPSKAPFSKRFEDAVGQACESASARQVARHLIDFAKNPPCFSRLMEQALAEAHEQAF